MERYNTLLLALLFDLLLGDPPNRFHPVAWMGTLIGAAKKGAPAQDGTPQGEERRFQFGFGLALSGMVICAVAGGLILRVLRRLPLPVRLPIQAIALKMLFSMGGLSNAAQSVQEPLLRGDIDAARHQLSWHLVSRDTSNLNESQIAASAIESVAENASDSIVAPLLFFMIGGLPAALAYRFSNTADAMLGYRDEVHEWLGKAPAKIDDALNYIPARLTAALFVLSAYVSDANGPQAWRIWRRDASQTDSPNAGQPMSAVAGALNITLDKKDHYDLGHGLPPAQPTDISRSINLLKIMTALLVVLLGFIAIMGRVTTRRRSSEQN